MGLRAVFQQAARTAFKAAGDVPVQCVYHQDRSDDLEQRDPVEFPVQALFGKLSWEMTWRFQQEHKGLDVLPGDVKATIRAEEMKVRPERGDTVTTAAGDRYRVIDFAYGTGEILVNLHLRRL